MCYAELYDKILFIVIICSSFFIISYNASVNKTTSFLKLLGWIFIVPFVLCISIFIFSASIAMNLILPLSEFCLAAGIFLILLFPYKSNNHTINTVIILLAAFALAVYIIRSEQFIYFTLSFKVRSILTAACIIASLILNKKREGDHRLITPMILWLASIFLGFVVNKQYMREGILFLKTGTFIAFSYYFYSTINHEYMKKINESQELVEKMERSLNKEVKKRVFEIEKSNERLLEISKTDLLTRTYNKITILNIIERLINNKGEKIFSILMFDIDDFKAINDSYGHITGDLCLKTLGLIASGNTREVDYLGRYGGDEFIIVLPNLAAEEARFVAERFRKKVSETSNPRFTISIGVATYPYDGQTVKDLLLAADKGLYKAKSKGKNSISHASLF